MCTVNMLFTVCCNREYIILRFKVPDKQSETRSYFLNVVAPGQSILPMNQYFVKVRSYKPANQAQQTTKKIQHDTR